MPEIIRQLQVAPVSQRQGGAGSGTKKGGARKWLTMVAREPFFQFMLLGLLIWGGVEYWSTDHDRYIITLGAAERQRIAQNYSQQFGQMPTPQQLQGLIDRYVREEIYWREAKTTRSSAGASCRNTSFCKRTWQ